MDKKIVIALAIVGILLIPGLFVLTENVKADVWNTVSTNYKASAYREITSTYEKTMVKVWRQQQSPNGAIVAVVTQNTQGTWLGYHSCQIAFFTANVGSQGDNSPSNNANDYHFYTTFYGYLPRNGQNYNGYGHVGTAAGYADVETVGASGNVGGANSYTVTTGSNYVNWEIQNGRWQNNWNGMTEASSSTSNPATSIGVQASYQTADWCVFWWNVHSTESFYRSIPASAYA